MYPVVRDWPKHTSKYRANPASNCPPSVEKCYLGEFRIGRLNDVGRIFVCQRQRPRISVLKSLVVSRAGTKYTGVQRGSVLRNQASLT